MGGAFTIEAPLVADWEFSEPVDGVTRASTTPGSLSTAWTQDIEVTTGDYIQYDLQVTFSPATNTRTFFSLMMDGVLIDASHAYAHGFALNLTDHLRFTGFVDAGTTGTRTFEVYSSNSNGGTVTVDADPTTVLMGISTSSGQSRLALRTVEVE